MSVAQNEWRNMLFADENTSTDLLSTTTMATSTLIEHKYLHDRCDHISCRLVSFCIAVDAVAAVAAVIGNCYFCIARIKQIVKNKKKNIRVG